MTVKTWRKNLVYLMKLSGSKRLKSMHTLFTMSLCRNGDIPGTSLLGLDRLKEKPPKPQKKRITPSVPLSSVERLGVCVCVRVCVCVCARVWVGGCACICT